MEERVSNRDYLQLLPDERALSGVIDSSSGPNNGAPGERITNTQEGYEIPFNQMSDRNRQVPQPPSFDDGPEGYTGLRGNTSGSISSSTGENSAAVRGSNLPPFGNGVDTSHIQINTGGSSTQGDYLTTGNISNKRPLPETPDPEPLPLYLEIEEHQDQRRIQPAKRKKQCECSSCQILIIIIILLIVAGALAGIGYGVYTALQVAVFGELNYTDGSLVRDNPKFQEEFEYFLDSSLSRDSFTQEFYKDSFIRDVESGYLNNYALVHFVINLRNIRGKSHSGSLGATRQIVMETFKEATLVCLKVIPRELLHDPLRGNCQYNETLST